MNAKNWPIVKVTLPADLKGVKPGEVPAYLLRDVQPEGKLHWRAADAYHAMRDKALADGIKPFKPTSAGDTYRSLAMQTTVFLQRYQKQPIAGAQTRTWEGVKWYKKSPTLASLAAPGTSQHNLGIAVDIWSASGKRFEWMLANALDFGFSWEVVPEEPWHLRYTAGDNVPPAVQAWLDRKKAVGHGCWTCSRLRRSSRSTRRNHRRHHPNEEPRHRKPKRPRHRSKATRQPD